MNEPEEGKMWKRKVRTVERKQKIMKGIKIKMKNGENYL